jgi:hypothetical protein
MQQGNTSVGRLLVSSGPTTLSINALLCFGEKGALGAFCVDV